MIHFSDFQGTREEWKKLVSANEAAWKERDAIESAWNAGMSREEMHRRWPDASGPNGIIALLEASTRKP